MTKHIGIVGCSAEGASLCYQTICKEGSIQMGEHAHPEISMHTHPLSKYMDCIYKDEWQGVVALMLSSSEKLDSAGAEFLICPDNTIHQVFKEVEKNSPLPWLHIARETAIEAERKGYSRSAVFGTRYLMTGPVYSDAYHKLGLNQSIPEEDVREMIDRIIFSELVYGKIRKESKSYLNKQIQRMADAGCDSVVLGCTELPLIILPDESPLPVLDSTRILARAALRESI